MGDGHLSVSASRALRASFEDQGYFPLSLVFLESGVYTFCDYHGIPKGSRIVSIDEIPMSEIQKKVQSFVVADGEITISKNWMLNSSFWFNYYLAYGYKQGFSIVYTTPGGETKPAKLDAIARANLCPGYHFSTGERLLNLSYPNKETALMNLQTFSYQSLKQANLDFGSFLDSAFRAINKSGIQKMVIDLRGNGGGADVYGAYLYSWLSDKPFRYYEELVTTKKKLAEADHPNLRLQQPNDIVYKGDVVFLVNGLTFSAAAEFCSVARSAGRGMFLGEETGGAYVGTLPGIPTVHYFPIQESPSTSPQRNM